MQKVADIESIKISVAVGTKLSATATVLLKLAGLISMHLMALMFRRLQSPRYWYFVEMLHRQILSFNTKLAGEL